MMRSKIALQRYGDGENVAQNWRIVRSVGRLDRISSDATAKRLRPRRDLSGHDPPHPH